MTLEYDHLRVSLNPRLQAEGFKTHFWSEPTHETPFQEVREKFKQSGDAIQKSWQHSLENGFQVILEKLLKEQHQIAFTATNEDGNETVYTAEYLGEDIDKRKQPIIVFRFAPEGTDPNVFSYTIATKQNKRAQFNELVVRVRVDRRQTLSSHAFHFYDGDLFSVLQSSYPGKLFGSFADSTEQFVFAQFGKELGLLTVVAGTDNSQHLYQNLEGDKIRTFRAKVNNGYMRLIRNEEDGVSIVSRPFHLPTAIEKIVNYEPATAA